jgi:hypothetical protein
MCSACSSDDLRPDDFVTFAGNSPNNRHFFAPFRLRGRRSYGTYRLSYIFMKPAFLLAISRFYIKRFFLAVYTFPKFIFGGTARARENALPGDGRNARGDRGGRIFSRDLFAHDDLSLRGFRLIDRRSLDANGADRLRDRRAPNQRGAVRKIAIPDEVLVGEDTIIEVFRRL